MEFYTIKPKQGDIPLLWGTYAMKLFCDKRNYSLEQLLEFIGKNQWTVADIADTIWAGAQYGCRKNGLPTDFDEMTVYEWIDECGGILGPQVAGFVKHIITTTLVNTTPVKKKVKRAAKR